MSEQQILSSVGASVDASHPSHKFGQRLLKMFRKDFTLRRKKGERGKEREERRERERGKEREREREREEREREREKRERERKREGEREREL
jgi:hypothetical protein